MYEDCAHAHVCVRTLEGMAERTIVVQSLSKTASATGAHVRMPVRRKQKQP